MVNCNNCFTPIQDLRKETRCSVCNKELHKDCAIKDGGTFFVTCVTQLRVKIIVIYLMSQ